jgi:hypothetical protein
VSRKNEQPAPPYAARTVWPALAASLVAALLFLYLRTFLYSGTPFVAADDQDLFFARAIRMMHGQVPYRDFFEIVTPATEWLYAAAFHLVGVHAWVISALAVAVGAAFCLLLTRMAQRLFSGTTILLPAALFLVMDFSSGLSLTHQWYSTLAAMAAVCVLMGGTSLRRLLSASVLCGAATLFTQTKGVFVFLAVACYLVWIEPSDPLSSRLDSTPRPSNFRHPERSAAGAQSKNHVGPDLATTSRPYPAIPIAKPKAQTHRAIQLAMLVLPYFAIVLAAMAYYVSKAGFHAVWFDLVVFPTKYMSTAELNTPITYLRQIPELVHVRHAADFVTVIPVVFIYLLVPFAYLAGGYTLWSSRTETPASIWRQLVLIHLVGVALFLAVAPGPRFFRLCTVAPPAVLIYVWLVERQPRVRAFLLPLSWIVVAAFGVLLPFHRQVGWHAALDLPIGHTSFSDRQLFDEFQWFSQHSSPGEMLFNDAALGLYLSLNNPTATEFINYDETTRPEQASTLLAAIQRRPPQFIVLEPATEAIPALDQTRPFRQYVYTHYRLAKVFPLNHSAYSKEVWVLHQ